MCLFFCFWRSACRPISLSLNTGFWRPISPFGLNTGFGYAIAPFGAIRSAYRLISLSLNTGSLFCQFAHLLRQRRHAGGGNVP